MNIKRIHSNLMILIQKKTYQKNLDIEENLPKKLNEYLKNINPVTQKKVLEDIKTNIIPNKVPGYELITGMGMKF